MQKGEDTRWIDLVGGSGAIDGACLSGIRVRAVGMASPPEDVVLCPAEGSDERLAAMQRAGRTSRPMQAERVFLSRAMTQDAATAAAMLLRAVVSNWTAMRGQKAVHDEHERRALVLAEAHLAAKGMPCDGDVLSAQRQIARNQIKPPVAHDCPGDVVRKAVAQMAAQIGGRHVLVLGDGPMAT